ncbi:ROK family transcriptional regulator [Salinispora tropica]|uniref:ROK family protein n=1 Tax=Salinispora tropica (strain ATCC BAA-916 / DSM 44818 / JCM 13857 / NBRC 105044 / CNB-440) TaxID=369723 RepID=A4X470_SALTO|nr:ROK family transcriptional regulator [Salinispora tropica]ABP53670.1 ROK family protein [Salinispora tropica CNB-440]
MTMTRLPGTPRLLRALNDRAALELLLEQGPLTRARLGELTGLSKVTASQLVERLEERGLVTRVGEQAGGRGPNAQLYAVRPGSAHVVGVDFGAERVVAACADITGAVVGRAEHPTGDTDDPVGVVHHTVVQAASSAGAPLATVRRVVLGAPGLVDPTSGDITFAFNLPRWHAGLLGALRDDLRAPVAFENDVNLVAMAEARSGAAQGVADFVLVWVDAGIGLAIVFGGRLHHGSTGAAGEIGWLPVPGVPIPHAAALRTKPAFQQLVGGEAVRALAREHGYPDDSVAGGVAAAIADGPAGDPMLDELARRLALGVASTAVVLDPPLVVLAGAVGRAGGAALAERVQREVAAIALVRPRVVPTGLTEEPILRGALHTALEAVRDEVFGSTTS